MQHQNVKFNHGFYVLMGDEHSQAAQMTLAPGETAGGPETRHQGADQWLFVHALLLDAAALLRLLDYRGDTRPPAERLLLSLEVQLAIIKTTRRGGCGPSRYAGDYSPRWPPMLSLDP